MQRLYSAANLPEAQLLAGMLAQAGIETKLFNQHAIGGMGELPFGETWPELWVVDERDLARARELLAEWERPKAPMPVWHCRACGEENPGEFDLCWRCGQPMVG